MSAKTQGSKLARQLLVFMGFQGAMSTFFGFGAVMVYTHHGVASTVQYVAWFMTAIMLVMVLPPAWQRWRSGAVERAGDVAVATLNTRVRWGFALPALLLPFSTQWPVLQAFAAGGFLGLTWSARLHMELDLLPDEARDGYASRVTSWTVVTSLLTTLAMSALLSAVDNDVLALYCAYAVLAAFGAWLAVRGLPHLPAPALVAPWRVMRQAAYLRCLPLYFLESGLWGIGMVLSASGAVHALGDASVYGWLVSAATLVGALALVLLRRHRHAGNRMAWMGRACLGMVMAQALLGGSAQVPSWAWLFPLHLLVLAAVNPFWQASEQVLNQRLLDLNGALADRIAVREFTLWAFRFSSLWLFWWVFGGWNAQDLLLLGSTLIATAQVLEWWVGRNWLRAQPEAS